MNKTYCYETVQSMFFVGCVLGLIVGTWFGMFAKEVDYTHEQKRTATQSIILYKSLSNPYP